MAMERKAAIIKRNVVTNVILIDDDTPKDLYDVELEADSIVSVGFKYKDGKFTAPKPEADPAPADDQE